MLGYVLFFLFIYLFIYLFYLFAGYYDFAFGVCVCVSVRPAVVRPSVCFSFPDDNE